jgi:hypothetical protein
MMPMDEEERLDERVFKRPRSRNDSCVLAWTIAGSLAVKKIIMKFEPIFKPEELRYSLSIAWHKRRS